jgi:hypothetical protein
MLTRTVLAAQPSTDVEDFGNNPPLRKQKLPNRSGYYREGDIFFGLLRRAE